MYLDLKYSKAFVGCRPKIFNHYTNEFKRLSKSYILKSCYGFTIINTVIIVRLTFNMLFAAIKIHNTGM